VPRKQPPRRQRKRLRTLSRRTVCIVSSTQLSALSSLGNGTPLVLHLKSLRPKRARRTLTTSCRQFISEPVLTSVLGKAEDGPKENGNGAAPAPAPGGNFQILSRIDDEGNDAVSEQGNPDEPANGEVVQDKAVKPREFIREPPKGPKAQQQHRDWRRKSSAPNTPVSPGPTASTLEEDGWSTVPAKNTRGRGRGGRGGGHHDNAGARAIAS
jgi:translation initiation factor 4B